MATARYKATIIAQSDHTVMVEGNHYFAPDSVNHAYLQPNEKQTVCAWKGTASYYDVVVNGDTAKAAAWYYPKPKQAASEIKDHVAFWGDVQVS